MKNFVSSILTVLIFFTSCTNISTEQVNTYTPQWPNAVMYEIFVQSFADSNGDGIGDINGMTAQLDYLQDLGIKGLWLMPMSPSPSYHKYDVTDYYGIHPDYGTMDDFKRFVQEAHKRDIKVVIDLVINHSGADHPWFQEAKKDKNSPYRDYYVWANEADIKDQIAKKTTHFDSDNINQWHKAEGSDELYYGYFWGGMPDMNFDNPKVKEEFFKVGKFWLQEADVDGFRLDAARHIFPDDRPTDNHQWWVEFKTEMQKIKPDVYTIGEIWANMETTAPYAKGFSAFFNFDLAFSILESVKQGKDVATSISHTSYSAREGENMANSLLKSRTTFKEANPQFYDAIFITNHDQNRIMTMLGNDIAKGKLAASILLTLPGTPYLYYGEEIGMLGPKPDPQIREPFLWDEKIKDSIRTSWEPSINSNDSTLKPLALQQADENSIFNHYKKLIHFRNSSDIMSEGEIEPIASADPSVLLYYRSLGGRKVLVIHNLSAHDTSLAIEKAWADFGSVLWSHQSQLGEDIKLGAQGSIILGNQY